MAGKLKGITLKIGGDTKGLSKALSDVNKQTKSMENELRKVDRLLKLDPKNTELLEQRQKLFGDEIKATTGKLDALKKSQEKVDSAFKSGNLPEQEYREFQREIIATEQKLKSLEKEASNFSNIGKKLSDAGSKMSEMGQKGMAISGVITGLGAAMVANSENTKEYRDDMARLTAAFETAGHSAETAKSTYSGFFSILGESDRSVEAVNHLAKLTNNQEELAKWTDICAGVSATFGDSLPIEGLTEAANETAKVGKVTGPLADALNWAGINEDAFNEALKKCNSEQERSSLITSTLSGTYQDAAKKFREANAEVIASREATQKLNDELAEMGALVAPIITAIVEKFSELLAWFNDLSTGSKMFVASLLAITATIPPLLILSGKLVTAVGSINTAMSESTLKAAGFSGAMSKLFGIAQAHPFAALAVAIVGIGVASDKSLQALKKLSEESKNLRQESDKLIDSVSESENRFAAESSQVNSLIDRLYSLEGQTDKTVEQKQEMHNIINQLNSLIPNLNLAINNETGALNLQRGTVQGLAQDYIKLAKAKAYSEQLDKLVKTKIELEATQKEINDALVEGAQNPGVLDLVAALLNSLPFGGYEKNKKKLAELDEEISNVSSALAEMNVELDELFAPKENPQDIFKDINTTTTETTKAVKTATEISKAEFDKRYKALNNSLQKQEISEAQYFLTLKSLRDEYLKGDAEAYEQYTIEVLQGLRDLDLRNLKYAHDMGVIEDKTYYEKLKEIRDMYFQENSSEWQQYTLEIFEFEKRVAEDSENTIRQSLENINKDFESKITSLQAKQDAFSQRLMSESSLLDSMDHDGTTAYKLHDWSKDVRNANEYNKAITELQKRLGPLLGEQFSDFQDSVIGGSSAEGRIASHILLSMSDSELQTYIETWRQAQTAMSGVAENAYNEQINDIKNNYLDAILETANGMSEEFEICGKTLSDFFGLGLISGMKTVAQELKSILQESIGQIPGVQSVFDSFGMNRGAVFSTVINQTINGGTSNSAYETAKETARAIGALQNMGEL